MKTIFLIVNILFTILMLLGIINSIFNCIPVFILIPLGVICLIGLIFELIVKIREKQK